jgi:hypothetical protein
MSIQRSFAGALVRSVAGKALTTLAQGSAGVIKPLCWSLVIPADVAGVKIVM